MSTGDKSSLPELGEAFAELRPALLRHCYRMLGSFEEAEDTVQDVLVRAWRSRDTYAGDAPLEHWLMRIATNACLNVADARAAARAAAARSRSDRARRRAPGAGGGDLGDARARRATLPRSRTRGGGARAGGAGVRRAPAAAAAQQRAVLLLKDVVGWSAEEIAAALELTVSSVNSALHRARETVSARPRAPAERR